MYDAIHWFWKLPCSAFDLWLIYLPVSSCLSLRVCGYDCGWYLSRSFPLIRSHHTGKKLLILIPFSSLCITWICIYFVQNYLSTLSKCLTMRKELILEWMFRGNVKEPPYECKLIHYFISKKQWFWRRIKASFFSNIKDVQS